MGNRFWRGYPLTDEQEILVELGKLGSLKVRAYSGAGKTSSLAALSNELDGPILYVAYTAAIVRDAKKAFPPHVHPRTGHSLAYRQVGHVFESAGRLKGRLTGGMVAEHLGLSRLGKLSPAQVGYRAITVMNRFLQDPAPSMHEGFVTMLDLAGIDDYQKSDLKHVLVRSAGKLWNSLISSGCKLPITHDVYLKLWILSDPEIKASHILFDESQDANSLLIHLMAKQAAPVTWVGDDFQSIYRWRGAVNAMAKIKTDHETELTQSFRFGQPIADLANEILNGYLNASVAIRGNPARESRISGIGFDTHDAIICRSNAGVITHLIEQVRRGRRVATAGGVEHLVQLLDGAISLLQGARAFGSDLSVFSSWGEVEEYAESPEGGDYKRIVGLVDENDGDPVKIKRLIDDYLSKCAAEKDADVLVTTAHKSKGREWDRVKLADDFPVKESPNWTEDEANLLYVAATRARTHLDIHGCDAIFKAKKLVQRAGAEQRCG